ncbi:hypothetical protein BU25DRAFT_408240 [Macroventuria anomochaeta]|uniref:Uncharacterized protein n=1 Tax=Macroventuria anomochaeta TaxID=301207 RepID=A0ACB6S804_9PLEO|nr:uncharacterized protein BU25DRAFT_408240 [Macroventuria anomochaeta]KAF2630266.1 hypothetical protein BU25DRAFT_408240 [Macroventuria anomochaeta]
MSETYHSNFGQQIFTDVSANGNSSGRDRFEMLDATQFYHTDRDYQVPGTLHLSGQDSSYAHGHPFAYASHSGPPSLPSLHTMPPMSTHLPSQYEPDVNILDELQGFSPVTAAYNMNAYRTPYPDSNATSTSSATSPDPQVGMMPDPIIVEADEDKRKRNQAASARFRQKKKQREQQLMEMSREMQEKMRKLESENEGLRKENLFLKKLLVEKVDYMSEEDREMLLKATGEALKKAS